MQANNLQHSLSVDPSDLKTSAQSVQSVILDSTVPPSLEEAIKARLATPIFADRFVAVRSSGTDEDSASHSFAGECIF